MPRGCGGEGVERVKNKQDFCEMSVRPCPFEQSEDKSAKTAETYFEMLQRLWQWGRQELGNETQSRISASAVICLGP